MALSGLVLVYLTFPTTISLHDSEIAVYQGHARDTLRGNVDPLDAVFLLLTDTLYFLD